MTDVATLDAEVTTASQTTVPVIELFGPTIQGEGPDAGAPVSFLRVGYCDFRCAWCDSLHAVTPELVKATARRMSPQAIVDALEQSPSRRRSRTVVISGGNPAVHDLQALVAGLHQARWKVHVETQGSIWRDWLASVDRLVVSPKPPSAGMQASEYRYAGFMGEATRHRALAHGVVKIVVFDELDFIWALGFHRLHPTWPLYLSAGTTPLAVMRTRHSNGAGDVDVTYTGMGITATGTGKLPLEDLVRSDFAHRWRWLAERCADHGDPRIKCLPQLHVLAWGHEKCR